MIITGQSSQLLEVKDTNLQAAAAGWKDVVLTPKHSEVYLKILKVAMAKTGQNALN